METNVGAIRVKEWLSGILLSRRSSWTQEYRWKERMGLKEADIRAKEIRKVAPVARQGKGGETFEGFGIQLIFS